MVKRSFNQLIGVSSKVVPTLSGVDVRRARSLWPTFLLLNFGNALPVSSQISTDFVPSAFSVMGFSGFIEVVGLTLWGFELFSNMRAGQALERSNRPQLDRLKPFAFTPQTRVADLLDRYPETLHVFLRHGFSPLANPILRKTMARVVTIEQACRREGIDLQSLFAELNQIVSAGDARISPALVTINGRV